MCNIAGYVGNRRAAPILLEMIKKQEGFAGGYFTGIATIHEGKMYYAKLTGDTDRLIAETNALSLPGNIGIAHSRSNSGGGDKWSHPFVGLNASGEPMTAYIANGAAGFFENTQESRVKIAQELADEGVEMLSRDRVENNIYQTLRDGTAVHMSDVMCQLITKNILAGQKSNFAMEKAFCDAPSEIVGLLISLTEPNSVAFARINMPVMVSFAKHGAYLASTALGFPEDAGAHTVLPPMSQGRVYKSRYVVHKFKKPTATLRDYDPELVSRAYANAVRMLEEEEHSFGDIAKATAKLYTGADLNTARPLAYEILLSLKREGKLKFETRRLPGAREGLTAPKTYMKL